MLTSKTWITIGIIISLALGIILGIVADRSIGRRYHHAYKGWGAKKIVDEHLLARLSRKLDLTRPQLQAIGGILRMQAVKINEAKQGFRDKIIAIKKESKEKIQPHLTPEQQERYDKLIAVHRKRWKKLCQNK